MKLSKRIFLFFIIIGFMQAAFGQTATSNSVDSSALYELRKIHSVLNLDSAQVSELIKIKKGFFLKLRALGSSQLSIEERKHKINAINTEYHNRLRSLLADNQYALYLQLEESDRTSIRQHRSVPIKDASIPN